MARPRSRIVPNIRAYAAKPCDIPGCTRLRQRVSPFCSTHREKQRHHGHPVLTAPPRRIRTRTIRLVKASIGPFLTDEVLTWLDGLRSKLSEWSSRMERQVDRDAARALAEAESVDLIAAAVGWVLEESRRDHRLDPVPQWLAWWPKRQARFNASQLAIWMKHAMPYSPGTNSMSRRAAARVTGMLLAYRSPTKLLAVATRLAQLVEPRVREALAEEGRAQRLEEAAKSEASRREQFPFGINDDGTVDIYRCPEHPQGSETA
jgi:hypothetical protein